MNENQTLSILLVDDDTMVLRTFARVLKTQGYQVSQFADPEAALAQFFDHQFDLVITDVLMPGLNGRQLAEKIWAIKPEQEILFISGNTSSIITQQDLNDHGWRLLIKPLTPSEFLAAVKEMAAS